MGIDRAGDKLHSAVRDLAHQKRIGAIGPSQFGQKFSQLTAGTHPDQIDARTADLIRSITSGLPANDKTPEIGHATRKEEEKPVIPSIPVFKSVHAWTPQSTSKPGIHGPVHSPASLSGYEENGGALSPILNELDHIANFRAAGILPTPQ